MFLKEQKHGTFNISTCNRSGWCIGNCLDVYSLGDQFEDPTPAILTEYFRGLPQFHSANSEILP